MATGSGTTRSGKTTPPRRRTAGKPLIIDVEAAGTVADVSKSGAAKTSGQTLSKTPEEPASGARPSPSAGLDEDTARAAGLSAGPHDAGPTAGAARTRADAPTAESQPQGARASAPPPPRADPASGRSGRQSGGAGLFSLFAAGLLGGLLALVLLFTGLVSGLVSLPGGDGDSLAAFEARLGALESRDAQGIADPAFDPDALLALRDGLADLRGDVDGLLAGAPGDASDSVAGIEASLDNALAPLVARLAALEAAAPAPIAGQSVAPTAALTAELATLRADLDAVRGAVGALEAGMDVGPDARQPQDTARLEALEALAAGVDDRLAGLDGDVAGLLATVEGLDGRVARLASELTALADAPVEAAPDRLARLGVALDALEDARDGGRDVSAALAAAQTAATFDGALMSALAPLSGAQISGPLSDQTLLGLFERVQAAMRDAAPSGTATGLLGALEERARQLVTIRTQDGSAVGGERPGGALDALGSLIAAGDHGQALALATGLPAAMQQAGNGLIDALHARVALDEAIAAARQALMAALLAPLAPVQTVQPAEATPPAGAISQ